MGAVLAKFRKPKTTIEILENLEQNIKVIEEYTISTQATQKRYVGNFLVISIGLYIIGFLIFYFAFFPPTWVERVTYSVPLLIFPLLIFLLKRLVAWHFQRKLNKNSKKLNQLRGEKKKILERVMETETYKVAIEILNRFADKSNSFKSVGVVKPNQLIAAPTTPQPQQSYLSPYSQGRTPVPAKMSTSILSQQQQQLTPQQSELIPSLTPSLNERTMAIRNQKYQLQKRKTPFPVINQQQQGVLERVVDYLIGDGPSNRFAMICKECFAHNGMALQEEFEYSAFRCAFCNALNPSRKSRPIAPKLSTSASVSPAHEIGSTSQITEVARDSSSTSPSERDSGPDSDDEGTDNMESVQSQNINEITTENSDELAVNEQGNDHVTLSTIQQQQTINETEKSSTEKKND